MTSIIGDIYTLYVNQYLLKYSKVNEDMIHVSIPSYAEDLPIKDKCLSAFFRDKLYKIGWRHIAINSLEKNVLFPIGAWKNCQRISIIDGSFILN